MKYFQRYIKRNYHKKLSDSTLNFHVKMASQGKKWPFFCGTQTLKSISFKNDLAFRHESKIPQFLPQIFVYITDLIWFELLQITKVYISEIPLLIEISRFQWNLSWIYTKYIYKIHYGRIFYQVTLSNNWNYCLLYCSTDQNNNNRLGQKLGNFWLMSKC